MQWSVQKYQVAERLAYSGKTKREIAKELALPVAVINRWCENSEFMAAVNDMVNDIIKGMKTVRIKYLHKVLQARIEEAEVIGYADSSNKDTVEIVAELRKETGEDQSKDSNYARLLEKLVLATPTQIINLGDQK